MKKYNTGSIAYKVEKRIQELQRLIDVPYEKWTKQDHYNNNYKTDFVYKSIGLDVIEGEVVMFGNKKDLERLEESRKKNLIK